MPMSTVKGQLLTNDAAGYAQRGNGDCMPTQTTENSLKYKTLCSQGNACTTQVLLRDSLRSFATNQLATKIFILSINTEVDNKRETLNAHVFFTRIVFKITQVALLFCDFLVMNVQ